MVINNTNFLAAIGPNIEQLKLSEYLDVLENMAEDIGQVRTDQSEDFFFASMDGTGENNEMNEQPHDINEITVVFQSDKDDYNGQYYLPLQKLRKMYESTIKNMTEDDEKLPEIIIDIYMKIGSEVFAKMDNSCAFVSVLYDANKKMLYAARGSENSFYTKLYYGHAKTGQIIFSTIEEMVTELCSDPQEFPLDSIYINGEITPLKSLKTKKFEETNDLFSFNNQVMNEFMEIICSQALKTSSEKINTIIDEAIEKRLKETDESELIDVEFKERIIYSLAKEALQEYKRQLKSTNVIKDSINGTLKKFETSLNKIVDKKLKTVNLPTTTITKIKIPKKVEYQTDCVFHEKFKDILALVSLNEPVMLVGPAGSGKNVVVSQVAETLGLKMYYTNNANNEFKITGFIDAGGNYQERPFYKAFKNGGIFFLDEIDNSDPSALIVINAALANGYMDFPHETITAHKDFRMIAAANTWGKGSDLEYVGRNALDASTLDRFDTIFFDYDRKMELALYPNIEILEYMWAFRDSILENGLHHIISTRGIGKVYKKHINNIAIELILQTNILKDMSEDDINIALSGMTSVSEDNEYLYMTKVLNGLEGKAKIKEKVLNTNSYLDTQTDNLPF